MSQRKARIPPPPATTPTVPATGPPVLPRKRIVVVFMENENAGTIAGSSCCPYETPLARRGVDLVHYHGVTYPSRPSYLAFAGGSTFGQAGNDNPLPTVRADNLFHQLTNVGDRWLRSHVPAWLRQGAEVFVTFDTGSSDTRPTEAAVSTPC